MAALDDELGTDPARRELQAAVAFARDAGASARSALKDREENKARDLASMARAGFAFDARAQGHRCRPIPTLWTKPERLAMVRPTRDS